MKRSSVLFALAVALSASACAAQPSAAPTPNLAATVQAQVDATMAAMTPQAGQPATATATPQPTMVAVATPTPLPLTATLTPPTATSLPATSTPDPTKQAIDAVLNQWVQEGLIVKGQQGQTYHTHQLVAVSTGSVENPAGLFFAVDGPRVSDDRMSLAQGMYYVIVTIGIVNSSGYPYMSDLSRFVLSDANGYTYSPTLLADTVGDVSGILNNGETRQGEIAFAVPARQRTFALRINTGVVPLPSLRFTVDTTSALQGGFPLPQH